MEHQPLRVLLVDRDLERGEELSAMLSLAAGAPTAVDLVACPADVAPSLCRSLDVVLLSLDPGDDPLMLASACASRAPDVPLIAINGDMGRVDPVDSLSRGIQEHVPRHCVTCRGALRLITAMRWSMERRRLLEKIEVMRRHTEELALHDPLTHLPNRQLFRDRLDRLLAHARRHGGHFAVMFLDLDRFKQINDTLGHDAGDHLLVRVAQRLRGCLRTDDTSARLGGDEFMITLGDLRSGQDAARVARKILSAITKPVPHGGGALSCTGSIGISLFPTDGPDAETLIRHADVAMYGAKAAGGNGYCFFENHMNEKALERLEIEGSLRKAVSPWSPSPSTCLRARCRTRTSSGA